MLATWTACPEQGRGLSANLPMPIWSSTRRHVRPGAGLSTCGRGRARVPPRPTRSFAARRDLVFAAQRRRATGLARVMLNRHARETGLTVDLDEISHDEAEWEMGGKAFDYTRPSLERRWRAGHAAARAARPRDATGRVKPQDSARQACRHGRMRRDMAGQQDDGMAACRAWPPATDLSIPASAPGCLSPDRRFGWPQQGSARRPGPACGSADFCGAGKDRVPHGRPHLPGGGIASVPGTKRPARTRQGRGHAADGPFPGLRASVP